jgi:peptidoglycan/LPS O-acetylase OafA/YrhL
MPGSLQYLHFHGLFPWFTIIAVLTYGSWFLGFSHGESLTDKFLAYCGEASYPYYILHQTVLVLIGLCVVQWGASPLVKYVIIAIATFIATTMLYEGLVRRLNLMRFLSRIQPTRELTQSAAPQEANP